MRKRFYGVVVLFAAAALVMSCGSSPKSQVTDVPEWLDELAPADAIWGIGNAKLQNDNLARQAASSRARREIAVQISGQVQGMLTDYDREAGTLDNSTSLQLVENVGRELVNQQLSGTTPNVQKRTADGTWWVRVSLSKADARNIINDVIENEASLRLAQP
ncbi:hypothetical protein AGMMS49991_00220 [Spirochaetia bacterium]|nr:hypothetical protein AGMMS49991_00220 [Spirochaetia bacterium]